MPQNVPCPRCNTPNLRPPGAAGVYCQGCGRFFQFEPKGFFDRVIEPFSSPKGIIISSAVMLVVFVVFWALLNFQSGPSKQNSGHMEAVTAPNTPNSETPEPSSPSPPAAPSPQPVVPIAPPARPTVAATVPTVARTPVVAGPTPHPLPPPVVVVGDKSVEEAIRRGARSLMSSFSPTTHSPPIDPTIVRGAAALATYALLQCNDTIDDPDLNPTSAFMQRVLHQLTTQPLDVTRETYGRSLRANALALIDRPVDRPILENDVAWLLRAARGGAYKYVMPPASTPQLTDWDNSNSQYGLLGVWAGTEVGIKAPDFYWHDIQKHWTTCQNPDGSFGYNATSPAGTLSMTAAGVASLCIAHDFLPQSAPIGIDSRSPSLLKALAWLGEGDHCLAIPPNQNNFASYALYGVARAGLASGYKYFGTHDWYRELGEAILKGQQPDGSFGDQIDTAFALLFLARGRHPVAFNKLKIDGVALDHARDISNLARYASRELEHTFNAQLVPITTDWTAWIDAPLLYLGTSHTPPITDEECDQLRNFARAGGLLFTHADGNSHAFNIFASKLAQRLFPEYPYQDLPPDHPLYHALFKLNPPPPLQGVSNGARLLMVNSPQDLAKSWDVYDWTRVEPAYRLGLNLFVYAAGERDFRNRLDTTYIAPPQAKPDLIVIVARLRYAGNWDPEPYAWTRFAHDFQWKTSFGVNPEPMDIKDLNPRHNPVADLTGTDAHQFTSDEISGMRNYVQQGGVLLIDSCGGMAGFASSQKGLLAALSPGAEATPIPPTHPLVNGNGPCMDKLPRPLSRQPGPDLDPPGIVSLGRGHIIVTPLDLTNALLDCRALGMSGYHPKYALPFVKNMLLWAYNGQPEQ